MLVKAGTRIHRLGERPVQLAGDVSLEAAADLRWVFPSAARRAA